MSVDITLNFRGRTEEALEFYCRTIHARKLFLMRFRERPDGAPLMPGTEEKIFHATFLVGETKIMASDCGCETGTAESFSGFALALRVETTEKAEHYFAALKADGQVVLPIAKTFFAERYGIVIDRFGVPWKIMVEPARKN